MMLAFFLALCVYGSIKTEFINNLFSSDNATYTYLEEFPIHLIHKLTDSTGHPASQVIVINLQYGAGYSGPASDVFRLDRATGDPSEAHQSNFLHPCLYYYKKLPSGRYSTVLNLSKLKKDI